MGKRKYLILLFLLFLVTGCGSKNTLTCEKSEDLNGIKMEQKAVIKTKKDKIRYVDMVITATAIDDSIKKEWNDFSKRLDEEYKEEKETGMTVKTENNKKEYSYKVTISMDLEKAKEESLKAYNLEDVKKDQTLKKIKEEEEKEGLKCKIK